MTDTSPASKARDLFIGLASGITAVILTFVLQAGWEAWTEHKARQNLADSFISDIDAMKTKEKVRLKSHLEYFKEVLDGPAGNGKKLNFISQEMGREINTIGSKANFAPMQKLVVNMKDELEKIKEQLQNII